MAIGAAIDLPFALYRQFVIEARYGFNRMTLALFFADLLKHTLLGIVIGAPVILAVLWLMAAMGSPWWLWVWLFWSAFNLLILFVYPTWIAPLFNKFAPLEDGEMKSRIEALLARCGFRSSGLFVMDGSKRSSHGNAYFTGFGNNKRIVFFDTLLARLAPPEVEAVLAHELGHFRRRHVVKRIVLMFAASLGFLWLLGQLIDAPWFYAGLGVPAQSTALALILFFLVVPVFTFPFTPAAEPDLAPPRVRGRRLRRRADRGGRSRPGAGQALRGQRGDADPRPAAFAVLRLPPAGRGAHRPARRRPPADGRPRRRRPWPPVCRGTARRRPAALLPARQEQRCRLRRPR